MATLTSDVVQAAEWMTFPGGELEGKRPKALCPACRERLNRAVAQAHSPSLARKTGEFRRGTLCFQCYRAELDRERSLKAAGQLDTASDARFQTTLPFEAVNKPRLEMLKVERSAARVAARTGVGTFVDKRHQAQIAARHALQTIAAGLAARRADPSEHVFVMATAIHAAELQLPESWLPFVVSR